MASKKKKVETNRTTKEGIFAESIFKFPDRLVVISEGDSWFSYPLNRNLADFLEMMGDFTMLRLEHNGDEARDMLAVGSPQYRKLRTYLKRYAKKLQLLLFSGGGNDVLAENLPTLLKKRANGMAWRACVDDAALAKRLDEIAGAYDTLLAIRDELAPNVIVVSHSYDYIVPDGRKAPIPLGLVRVGPWCKPVLDRLGITDPADAASVMKYLIDAFRDRIAPIASPARQFYFVDARGTLPSGSRIHWSDEIHPTGTGFELLAQKWRPTLAGLFPGKGF